MKLSEFIEKHGNKEVDEQVFIDALGLKKLDKLNYGDVYWFVNANGDVISCTWLNMPSDNYRNSQGNCFPTAEEAEAYKRVLETESKLRQYAKEHNEGEIEWDNARQRKYNIHLDLVFNEVCIINTSMCKFPRRIYFTSEKIANAAIEAVGKEAVMEYLQYEW